MRRYAYVGMFVVAAVLTPPDVITQCWLGSAVDHPVRDLDLRSADRRKETGRRLTLLLPSREWAGVRGVDA